MPGTSQANWQGVTRSSECGEHDERRRPDRTRPLPAASSAQQTADESHHSNAGTDREVRVAHDDSGPERHRQQREDEQDEQDEVAQQECPVECKVRSSTFLVSFGHRDPTRSVDAVTSSPKCAAPVSDSFERIHDRGDLEELQQASELERPLPDGEAVPLPRDDLFGNALHVRSGDVLVQQVAAGRLEGHLCL